MFRDFAENTGEVDRSVICSRCFITFFEDGADLGSTPLCREFACLDGAFKDDLFLLCFRVSLLLMPCFHLLGKG